MVLLWTLLVGGLLLIMGFFYIVFMGNISWESALPTAMPQAWRSAVSRRFEIPSSARMTVSVAHIALAFIARAKGSLVFSDAFAALSGPNS